MKNKNNSIKHAIVMGATSGIGREVALLLARSGWRVAVAGRRCDRLQSLLQTEENIVEMAQIDINDEAAVEQLHRLVTTLGGMDLYFHSSGIGWYNPTLDSNRELQTVVTNGVGFVRMVDAAFAWMACHGGGRIACITSIAGTRGLGAAPAYSATKRFQSHYIESLSQQARMRRLPIWLTDIRPGFVDTDLIAGSHFPMQMSAAVVARHIVSAIERGRRVVVINSVYRLLVALWALIPHWLWVRLRWVK